MKRNSASASAESQNNIVFTILKGAFFAVFASLILVLVFAFIIKFSNLSDGLIRPINQTIKVVSILAGVFFTIKKSKGQGLFKGILVGAAYVVLSFIVFSILDGSFQLSLTIFNDLLFGAAAGAASGIIASLVR